MYLTEFPEGGHWRRDLTAAKVRFFSVYSYLIVYRPETKPLQIVAILHGRREVAKILPKRGILTLLACCLATLTMNEPSTLSHFLADDDAIRA